MLVPKKLYGYAREVTKLRNAEFDKIKKGARFSELELGELLDTDHADGLVIIDGSEKWPDKEHFHVGAFAIGVITNRSLGEKNLWDLVFWSFERAWSFAGLLGIEDLVYRNNELVVPLLQAALRHWSELVALEQRITRGYISFSIWQSPTLIHQSLGRLGVKKEQVIKYPPNLDEIIHEALVKTGNALP